MVTKYSYVNESIYDLIIRYLLSNDLELQYD